MGAEVLTIKFIIPRMICLPLIITIGDANFLRRLMIWAQNKLA